MAWTFQQEEQLKQLWAEGYSASEIAREMGATTRNAVLGKAHRMGLDGSTRLPNEELKKLRKARQQEANRRHKKGEDYIKEERQSKPLLKDAPKKKFKKLTQELPEFVEPERANPRDIQTLEEGECKFPIGEPKTADFYFCGARQKDGSSYCPHHHEIAYRPLKRTARKTATSSDNAAA